MKLQVNNSVNTLRDTIAFNKKSALVVIENLKNE